MTDEELCLRILLENSRIINKNDFYLPLKKLVDRNIPMGMKLNYFGIAYQCPICNGLLRLNSMFCPDCGQRLIKDGRNKDE